MLIDSTQIYVLKQFWRPTKCTPEGKYYKMSQDNATLEGSAYVSSYPGPDIYYSSEDVISSSTSGTVDTERFIRRSVKSSRYPPPLPFETETPDSDHPPFTPKNGEPKEIFVEKETKDSFAYVYLSDLLGAVGSSKPPTYRTQHRILLKEYGWSVKYAASLEEFVRVIKHSAMSKFN